MKVTTEPFGLGQKVIVEADAFGTNPNAIRTLLATVDDNGRLSLDEFQGKTIDFIKRYFIGRVDGNDVIGRDSTTLFSDGVIDVGAYLAGQEVVILQLGETFYTSDAKVFAESAEAARDEIVAKIPFDTITDGQIIVWDAATNAFIPADGGGGGAVDSVNGQTGAVVLDADDIDDAATTNKFTTAGNLTKLAGIEAGAQVNDVDSVAGKTGAVSLDKTDVGLANVDNTSDLNKPISTATQTALDTKLDDVTAGTNVTIDKTNPLNPVISASGGGGDEPLPTLLRLSGPIDNMVGGNGPAATPFNDFDYQYNFTNNLPFVGDTIRTEIKMFVDQGGIMDFIAGYDANNYQYVRVEFAGLKFYKVEAGIESLVGSTPTNLVQRRVDDYVLFNPAFNGVFVLTDGQRFSQGSMLNSNGIAYLAYRIPSTPGKVIHSDLKVYTNRNIF